MSNVPSWSHEDPKAPLDNQLGSVIRHLLNTNGQLLFEIRFQPEPVTVLADSWIGTLKKFNKKILKNYSRKYITLPSSSLISKFTSNTYIKVLASGRAVIEPHIMSAADATLLLMDLGARWKALAKQAKKRLVVIMIHLLLLKTYRKLSKPLPLCHTYKRGTEI